MKRSAQIAVAVLLLLFIGALSRVGYMSGTRSDALLRLSWRTRGEAVKQCRKLTEEELEELPAHMRTPEVCTGRVASYQLDLSVDDRAFQPMRLRAAGAHADRPIYVFRELGLKPGEHNIAIAFYSTAHPNSERLTWRRRVSVKQGEILLVTADQETGQLALRRDEQLDE